MKTLKTNHTIIHRLEKYIVFSIEMKILDMHRMEIFDNRKY